MTVLNDQPPYEQYTGTGERVYFEYGFPMLPDSTVVVLVNGIPTAVTLQAMGVVFAVAPALGDVINIYRYTDITQLSDWQTFESFDAAKTEDALDKLILLKQEAAAYRALMNLYALHELPSVTIVNNKGTSAVIFYWNETVAGVFGGEVTENMPNAGAIVEKPEDFAYFQYGQNEIFTQELTSTLYPLEEYEAIWTGITLAAGSMSPIPEDGMDITPSFLSGSLVLTLLDTGPYEDGIDITPTFLSGTLIDVLLETGPYIDGMDFVPSFLSGTLEKTLINAYAPYEGVRTSISLVTGTMTSV